MTKERKYLILFIVCFLTGRLSIPVISTLADLAFVLFLIWYFIERGKRKRKGELQKNNDTDKGANKDKMDENLMTKIKEYKTISPKGFLATSCIIVMVILVIIFANIKAPYQEGVPKKNQRTNLLNYIIHHQSVKRCYQPAANPNNSEWASFNACVSDYQKKEDERRKEFESTYGFKPRGVRSLFEGHEYCSQFFGGYSGEEVKNVYFGIPITEKFCPDGYSSKSPPN